MFCPWDSLQKKCEVSLISLNPSGNVPQGADLRTISDERGNSYVIEKETTQSPITHQILMLFQFLGIDPSKTITGVLCPFRSISWSNLSREQRHVGVEVGKEFWSAALRPTVKTVIALGGDAGKILKVIFNSSLEIQIPSNWGDVTLSRFSSLDGPDIIQLPHLSRYKLFSSKNWEALYKPPLQEVFRIVK